MSERRIERLLNPHLSGLPAFLAKQSGLHSGYMLAQYTAAALVSENKVLAHPASVDSIPTSANQEDFVSMGAHAARKAVQILRNVSRSWGSNSCWLHKRWTWTPKGRSVRGPVQSTTPSARSSRPSRRTEP